MHEDEILEDDADGDYYDNDNYVNNYYDDNGDQEGSESTNTATVGEEGGALVAQVCKDGDDEYSHEDTVPHSNPCKLCQCFNGEIVCATKECELAPHENCRTVPLVEGACCPTYECEDQESTMSETSTVTETSEGDTTTAVPTTTMASVETTAEDVDQASPSEVDEAIPQDTVVDTEGSEEGSEATEAGTTSTTMSETSTVTETSEGDTTTAAPTTTMTGVDTTAEDVEQAIDEDEIQDDDTGDMGEEEEGENEEGEGSGQEAEDTDEKEKCSVGGVEYLHGEDVTGDNSCDVCKCSYGEVVCAIIDCTPPPSANCKAIGPAEGQCCPTYECEEPEPTSTPEIEDIPETTVPPMVDSEVEDDEATTVMGWLTTTVMGLLTSEAETTTSIPTTTMADTEPTSASTAAEMTSDSEQTSGMPSTTMTDTETTTVMETTEAEISTLTPTTTVSDLDKTETTGNTQTTGGETTTSIPTTTMSDLDTTQTTGIAQSTGAETTTTIDDQGDVAIDELVQDALGCTDGDVEYSHGDLTLNYDPCKLQCQCLNGKVECAIAECVPPPSESCLTISPPQGECCPTYQCEDSEDSATISENEQDQGEGNTELDASSAETTDVGTSTTIPPTTTMTDGESEATEAGTTTVMATTTMPQTSTVTETSEGDTTTAVPSIDASVEEEPEGSESVSQDTDVTSQGVMEEVPDVTQALNDDEIQYDDTEDYEEDDLDDSQEDMAEEMPEASAQSSDNLNSESLDDVEETPESSVDENEGMEMATGSLLDTEQTVIQLSCIEGDVEYMNGEKVAYSNPCKLCQCTNGEIVCADEACDAPDPSKNCMKIDPAEGVCCPTYECPDTTITTEVTSSSESEDSAVDTTTSMPTTSEGIADVTETTDAGITTSETSGAETEDGTTTTTTESEIATTAETTEVETSTTIPPSTTMTDGESETTEAGTTTVMPTTTMPQTSTVTEGSEEGSGQAEDVDQVIEDEIQDDGKGDMGEGDEEQDEEGSGQEAEAGTTTVIPPTTTTMPQTSTVTETSEGDTTTDVPTTTMAGVETTTTGTTEDVLDDIQYDDTEGTIDYTEADQEVQSTDGSEVTSGIDQITDQDETKEGEMGGMLEEDVVEEGTGEVVGQDTEEFKPCMLEDVEYLHGEDIKGKPCVLCNCIDGEIVCASIDCQPPPSATCNTVEPAEGQCCPTYECEEPEPPSPPEIDQAIDQDEVQYDDTEETDDYTEENSEEVEAEADNIIPVDDPSELKCIVDDKTYDEGEDIPQENDCKYCQCQSGQIMCWVKDCTTTTTTTTEDSVILPQTDDEIQYDDTEEYEEYDNEVQTEIQSDADQPDTIIDDGKNVTIEESGVPDHSEVTQEETTSLSGGITAESDDGVAPSVETETAEEADEESGDSDVVEEQGDKENETIDLPATIVDESQDEENNITTMSTAEEISTTGTVTTIKPELDFNEIQDDDSDTETSCIVDGITYENYVDLPSNNPCLPCFCNFGEVLCTSQECPTPQGYEDCVALPTEPGVCCPKYQCGETDHVVAMIYMYNIKGCNICFCSGYYNRVNRQHHNFGRHHHNRI